MKKRKINLIANREDYQKYEDYFLFLRKLVFFIFLIFFISFFYFFIKIRDLNKKINFLNLEKTTALRIINDNAQRYADLSYLNSKYSDFKNFYADDANFYYYYSFFDETIKDNVGSSSVKIINFEISKNRDFKIKIIFNDISSLMNFFKFAEKSAFLKNFETNNLKSFNFIRNSETKEEKYEIDLEGRFVPYEKILIK